MSKNKKWDATIIHSSKLVFCDWNVNTLEDREFAELCSEIEEGGFDEPCQVVPIKEGENQGKYLVLGGEHRCRAMMALQRHDIPCVIKEHLTDADEKTLMLWSVKRNNIRGKVDLIKYAQLEQRLKNKWNVDEDLARQKMLMRDERLKKVKARLDQDKESLELSSDDDVFNAVSGSGNNDTNGNGSDNRPSGNSGKRDKFANRRALLQALKSAEQEVLLQSEETLDNGYLFFTQAGANHLVISESDKLNDLVNSMVKVCKKNADTIDDFLISAITAELSKWSK